MSISIAQIAALVRNRLNLPVSERLRLQSFVAEGLTRLSDRTALSRSNRHLLLTSRASTTAVVTNGQADLTNLITAAPFLNLERIRCGSIWITGNPYPLEWRTKQLAALPSETDDLFVSCWLTGNILNVSQNAGVVSLSVPFIPTINTLPDSLIDELTDIIVEIATNGGVKADA